MGTRVRPALGWTSTALLLAAVVPTPTSAQTFTRKAALASLERVLAGEVLHTEYGEGAQVQIAVNAAFERGDTKIIRLAQRAWRPIVTSAFKPVGTVSEPPVVTIESRTVLKLPRQATYSAEIFCSLNGGPFTHVGTLDATDHSVSSLKMPAAPREPGFHHLRFQARITYGAAAGLPQETRKLADVSYGVYDPEHGLRPDIAQFVMGPRMMSAYQLDPNLPGIPLIEWLRWLPRGAGAHAEDSLWTSVRCPRGPRILEHPSNFGDICALGYLPFGLVWIRTGRIEPRSDGARIIAQPPKVLAIQVGAPPTEIYTLSELPELLASDPEDWPAPHISLVPQDIVVARTGAGSGAMLEISVTIRNQGRMDARDLLVTMLTSNGNELYMFHVDVPRRGSTTFKWSEAMPWPYGAVLVSADTPQRRPPAATGSAEPIPDDGRAFRIVNPSLAPPEYLNWIREWHAISKGY
jgi:hypothetical protein